MGPDCGIEYGYYLISKVVQSFRGGTLWTELPDLVGAWSLGRSLEGVYHGDLWEPQGTPWG